MNTKISQSSRWDPQNGNPNAWKPPCNASRHGNPARFCVQGPSETLLEKLRNGPVSGSWVRGVPEFTFVELEG